MRLFFLPEYRKGLPLMKISSAEDKKAVPMELISLPEGLFSLCEGKKGIREECFCFPVEKFSFPEQLFCLRERLFGIPEGLFAPCRDYAGWASAHYCDPPGCDDSGKSGGLKPTLRGLQSFLRSAFRSKQCLPGPCSQSWSIHALRDSCAVSVVNTAHRR